MFETLNLQVDFLKFSETTNWYLHVLQIKSSWENRARWRGKKGNEWRGCTLLDFRANATEIFATTPN